ncbi:periplasmic protein [Shewanella colwelliana]|uniref:Periplasmic protein n=1 Tax=Shewanella colwelliana TaxID=23 RepID=A0ABQ4P0D0_SHECO|nr:periplasmic protein [Shewanella colwelliana]
MDGVCTYSNTVEAVYDYCPNGMTDLGADCRLSQYVQLTKSCESPFAVSSADKCEFIETVPAGFASGTESKLFEGDIVSELSAITFDNKEFDAVVSEVAEIATDIAGGCRLVDTLSDAEGELTPGNVPCLVRWDSLPEGLTADRNSVTGIFKTAGTHSLAYTLLGYEGAEKSEFEIAKGQIEVNVTMPPKPVVSDVTTRMMGKVLAGTEIYNYDPASRLEFTTVLVEPRNYEQLITIPNLGSCTVAAQEESCVIYSNVSYERDPDNLQIDESYQIIGNSVIGGWDASELTPASWLIHHDFRGPNIAFSVFNTDIEGAPIENSDLGYTVSVEGQRGAVGINNIRPELPATDVWWKPSRVDLRFTAKSGSERSNKLDIEGYQVTFNLPMLTGDEFKISSENVISKDGAGSAYEFAMADIVPGDYVVEVIARDAFGNESIKTINDVSIPTPSPQIKVLLRGNSIESQSSSPTVDMLDDLIIVGHNGVVGDTEIVSVKIDGRDALAVNSEGFYKHLTGEGFGLTANQIYSLDVTARDSKGKESTLSLLINYLQMTFGISSKPNTVVSKVEDVTLAVNRTRGIRCDLYGTKAAAALASTTYNHACYIEWTELPAGLTPLVTTYQSRLSGAVQNTGTMSATYTAYIVNKDMKSAEISSETITFEAMEPVPLKVQMDERTKLADGVYSVSVNDTLIGRYTGESSRAHVDVTLSDDAGNEKVYKHNQLPFADVQTFSAYANKLGAPSLWDRIPYKLNAAYRLAPEMQTQQDFDLIITPHPYMQVLLDMGDGRFDSTQTINATVQLGMRNSLTGQYEYDPATMGDGWDVFVAFKNGTEYEPISTISSTGADGKGVVQVDANTIFERNQAVYAVAKAHSPYSEIEVTRVSIPRSVTVVKGTEVEGSLFARVVQSRVPAVFDVRFDTSSINDFLVMGDIRWQFKDANGQWQDNAAYNDMQYISLKSEEPETIGVRAIVTNKSSGAVTTSEELTLISYDVPQVSIVGGNQAIVGQTMELVAQDNSDTPQADTVVEWSIDDGATWEPGLSTYSLTVGEGTMKVYARMKYANTSDNVTAGQWSQAVKYIAVSKPKPLIMNVSRPSMAEVGTDITLALQVSNPFAATGVPVKTEWELPDGTIIADQNELVYSVVQEDLDGSNRISVRARSWLEGYKNLSMGEMNILINTFTYQFPAESDMNLTITNNIKFTPSSGYAALSMPYINAPGVTFTYDWTFDGDAIEQTLSSGKSMNFVVKQAGVHEIMLTVSDNRGNFAHLTGFVEAVEPAPMEFKMSNVYSNKYLRAPLNVSLYPSVTLSHPYDYIKEYVWTINGEVGEPSSRAIGTFDALPVGHYEVELNVTSNYGQPGKYTTSFDVVANKPPVCEPKARDQYGTYIVDANCTDHDGVISYYRWVINGTEFTPYGAQVRLSATDYPSAQITIEAVDDAGATGVGTVSY